MPGSVAKTLIEKKKIWKEFREDFPGGSVVKNLPADAGDMVSIPGPGRRHTPQTN